MWRYSIDYTQMPPGTRTRNGVVSDCPQCGRRGAMMRWTTQGRTFERWLHLEQGRYLLHTETFSCSRQVAGPPPPPAPGTERRTVDATEWCGHTATPTARGPSIAQGG
jgi:hypothetical protein